MTASLAFPATNIPSSLQSVRAEVRRFLDETPFEPKDLSNGFDPEFSRQLASAGLLAMTWPKEFGGHERSAIERYVVLEELLAAGAPVAAHWIADRQTGPLLLKYGTEEQKRMILPRIARGEYFTCIGMSEADAGSDLSAIRTRAEPIENGYLINGSKMWTSHAHRSHAILLFCRTASKGDDRKSGTSQLLVDLATPGISIRPIEDLVGERHFNEVIFENVQVPASVLVGVEGQGWHQIMSELALERSGPERFLSSFALLKTAIAAFAHRRDALAAREIGRLTAHLSILRRLSFGLAQMIENGEDPAVQAAIVKDLGSLHEQEIPAIVDELLQGADGDSSDSRLEQMLVRSMLISPSYSIRGGAREILRGIVAKSIGLR